jgi:predicted sulfurtransferase
MNQKNKNYLIIILVVFFILLFGFIILKEKNNSVNVNNIKEVRKQEIKKHLTGSEFLETYKNSSDAILVDIRTKEEFDSGNISGSINVDFYDKDFISNIKSLGTR